MQGESEVYLLYWYKRTNTDAKASARRNVVVVAETYIAVCSLVLKYLQPGTKISGRPGAT